MSVWKRFYNTVRALLKRNQLDAEMKEEMRAHLEMRIAANIESGMSPQEARFAALRQFGHMEGFQEVCRDQRRLGWIDDLFRDIRVGFRMLRKNLCFTFAVVFTIALGIGANTAVFTVFNAILLRPPDVKEPDSLARLYPVFSGQFDRQVAGNQNLFSYSEYRSLETQAQSFDGLTAYTDVSLTLDGIESQTIQGTLVSGSYFPMLGTGAAEGRLFSPQDCITPGGHPIAVISYSFWISRMGGDSKVIGRTISLNRQIFTIVGVTAHRFNGFGLARTDVWIPLMMHAQLFPTRDLLSVSNASWLRVIARRKPGFSNEQIRAELTRLAGEMDRDYPGRETVIQMAPGTSLQPVLHGRAISVAALMLAAVGTVLIIACVNVANMMLARAASRQTEFGVRLDLGGARGRVIQQLLTESLLLAFCGGVSGLVMGCWLSRLLWATVAPFGGQSLIIDTRVLIFTALITVAAAILFGLVPALQSTKRDLAAVLRGRASLFGQGVRRSRLRNSLVIGQIALSLVLLTGAGLFMKSLFLAYQVDPGYATHDVIVLSPELAKAGYSEAQGKHFFLQLQDRLAGMPGIAATALVGLPPLSGGNLRSSVARGDNNPDLDVSKNFVSARYFATLGIKLLRGREFRDEDMRASRRVAIINEATAEALWPDGDPIGKWLREGRSPDALEIVGVVQNTRSMNLAELDGPVLYSPIDSVPMLNARLLLRVEGEVAATASLLRAVIREQDKNVGISLAPLEQSLERWRVPWKQGASFAGVIGTLATSLACLGLYGVMAFDVSQRRRELGIRAALGATRVDLLSLILVQGAKTICIGLVLGLGCATALSVVVTKQFFGVRPLDPLMFSGVALMMGMIALLACWLPARRATRLNPNIALRQQ